jgi:hypothetical protein
MVNLMYFINTIFTHIIKEFFPTMLSENCSVQVFSRKLKIVDGLSYMQGCLTFG